MTLGSFCSSFPSKCSLSVMINSRPHVYVCRPVCQKTHCLSGACDNPLWAVTPQEDCAKLVLFWKIFLGILHIQSHYSQNQMMHLQMPASWNSTALLTPTGVICNSREAPRLSLATATFLTHLPPKRNPNTKHLYQKALQAFSKWLRSWSSRNSTVHGALIVHTRD